MVVVVVTIIRTIILITIPTPMLIIRALIISAIMANIIDTNNK